MELLLVAGFTNMDLKLEKAVRVTGQSGQTLIKICDYGYVILSATPTD